MAFIPQVHPKDAVFTQRDDNNTKYEQINISGSDAVIYLDEFGHIMADKIDAWKIKYGFGAGGSSVSSSWASQSLSSSFIAFNGNRVIKRDDPDFEGLNVGGTNVVDFLENFFFPFIPATISINSGATYETGSSQNITVAGTITGNDELLFGTTGSIRKDGNGLPWASFPSASTYSVSDNPLIGTGSVPSHTYKSYFYTDNDGVPVVIESSTKTISFIFPYFYGTSAASGLSDNTLYTTLTKLLQTNGSKTVTMSGTDVYMYFCYPAAYADLTSIKDPNLFEILSAFEYSGSVSVTSSGLYSDWTQTYKVYRTLLQSSPNGSYIFT